MATASTWPLAGTGAVGLLGWLALCALVLAGLPATPATAQTGDTPDRFGTAARIATTAHPDGSDVVLLASGENYPDALAGAAAAEAYDAPILLTARTTVPPATAQALRDLDAADVIVLGGTAAVGQEVVNALSLDYEVSRLAGGDRFSTAARIAADAHPDGSDVVVLASGENYPDALAGAAIAYAYDAPILLTARTTVPAATAQALRDLDAADVIVLGGTAAVGQEVVNTLTIDYQVSRVAGGDRFSTAARIAADAHPDGSDVVLLASGENYPDALAGAALVRYHDAPILLTATNTVPDATAQALRDLDAADVIVLGGTAAVGQQVVNALTGEYQVSRIAGGSGGTTTTVQVFFANDGMGDPCGDVFPVDRTVTGPAVATAAMTELLEGPTPAEREQGYGGWFSADTAGMLHDVHIEDGVGYADFADLSEVIPNASTACGSAGLLAQLDSTMTQFDTVDSTRYALDGDVEAFYEWLQLGAPTGGDG